MNRFKNTAREGGFTIVELLTVMGVIAILIGLLVPALSMVKDYAKQVQQSAQFHSIEVGLDLYKAEFGAYPPSNDNAIDPVNVDDDTPYCGANKLAEALVGQDFLGFHPNSDFRASGTADVIDRNGNPINDLYLYNIQVDVANFQTGDENARSRGGKFGASFVELENANAFLMTDVYVPGRLTSVGFNTTGTINVANHPSMVLCDVYSKKRNTSSARKTGMPILYYRARTQFTEQDYSRLKPTFIDTYGHGGIADDIYFYLDNYNLLRLQTAETNPMDHPLADGAGNSDYADFQNMIINTQISTPTLKRPYRAQSYILISAGKDGLYGTSDDITNFKKE